MNFKSVLGGFAAVLIIVVFFGNCTKIKTTDIGVDLLPAVDNVHTFDTSLEVISTNYYFGDSALPVMGRDVQGTTSDHVLGYISNDPLFGKTTAAIYLELKPTFYKYYFENVKDSLYLDSIVLCMKWTGTWGDTTALQKVNVYEMDQVVRRDTSYATNISAPVKPGILGSKTFAPSILNDSIFPVGQKLAGQLRIRLNDELGNRFLAQDSAAFHPYASDSLFRAFFNGFAIIPETTGDGANANALMNFALNDTSTHLRLYYRYKKNGVDDTTARNFNFDAVTFSAHLNHIVRDYSGSEIAAHIPSNPAGDSVSYIQTSPGTYNIIKIPSLNNFVQTRGNVMVHLASLEMTQVPGPNDLNNILTAPPALYLDYLDTTIKKQRPILLDGFLSLNYNPAAFGGVNKPVTENGVSLAQYKFFISRYVQSIVTKNTPNFPLYLYSPWVVRYPDLFMGFGLNTLAWNRVKLGGGSYSGRKMKLRIIYSLI
ncbi:DUF4270 family protein [Pollutibacter soli]|uniref:DUF4270 family protein n=1 Tax=Pollutibacter soli TaxID=3034157 RepID=UPI003013A073